MILGASSALGWARTPGHQAALPFPGQRNRGQGGGVCHSGAEEIQACCPGRGRTLAVPGCESEELGFCDPSAHARGQGTQPSGTARVGASSGLRVQPAVCPLRWHSPPHGAPKLVVSAAEEEEGRSPRPHAQTRVLGPAVVLPPRADGVVRACACPPRLLPGSPLPPSSSILFPCLSFLRGTGHFWSRLVCTCVCLSPAQNANFTRAEPRFRSPRHPKCLQTNE